MELTVRNVDFNYVSMNGELDSVNIRFDYHNIDGTSLSGVVKITKEEYNANATNLPELGRIAKEKIKSKINES